jgi:glycosyltransferase involved in cell wall biosynthesis
VTRLVDTQPPGTSQSDAEYRSCMTVRILSFSGHSQIEFSAVKPPSNTIVLIPVFNEEANIEPLLTEVREHLPDCAVCLINDCSVDSTVRVLRKSGWSYLDLPCNLGVGGAMQAGFRYAYEQGFDYAIRLDGDGQHPPSECARLIERMNQGEVDMVVGSRFLGDRSYTSTLFRQAGIWGLATALSVVCRRRITDPTSGFQIVNRAVMYYFAHQYPGDYPEPESLALLSRQGYSVCEVPAQFRARNAGQSSIRKWGTLFYMFKVGVALFVDRCRAVDPRFDRKYVENVI